MFALFANARKLNKEAVRLVNDFGFFVLRGNNTMQQRQGVVYSDDGSGTELCLFNK